MKKLFSILIIVFAFLSTQAQDYVVTFSANGDYSDVDSVQIENITQSKTISVLGTDVLHLVGITGIDLNTNQTHGLQIYPNPTSGLTNINFISQKEQTVTIQIIDITGKIIHQNQSLLSYGNNQFTLTNLARVMYVLNMITNDKTFSETIISNSYGSGDINVQLNSTNNNFKSIKSEKSTIEWQYDEEDILIFKAYSNGHAVIRVYYITANTNLWFTFFSCEDLNGHKYATTTINGVTFMAENLRTSKYNNNITIPNVTDNTEWVELTTGGRCYYENDSMQYAQKYGALYNYEAVITGDLCPNGWHIPTETEWVDLLNYLQNSGYNYDGNSDSDDDPTTNNKIAKSMCVTSDWYISDVVGTPGNTDFPSYRNRSGFSAIGGGIRNPSIGNATNLTRSAKFWSSTETNTDYAKGLSLSFDSPGANIGNDSKTFVQSVRCIKD
ncbi:MAG: hypothetical protein C0596_08900 [Marinilabiliales bacterium]|nr:MAG: hypothetical protein C0596_08900 [Marinilabiliales bacterium]